MGDKIMELEGKHILVTGGNGFLGKQVVKFLEKINDVKIVIPTSKEFDLRNIENCKQVVKDIDVVFHLAAHVGGIGLNREKPAELFYDNLMMGTQLLHEAKISGVKKFIALGTICSYPKFSNVPFLENDIWNGYPEETNAPYGIAKKTLMEMLIAYNKQYGMHSANLIPVNMYGPCDNFNPASSHVIPALILKIDRAITVGHNIIELCIVRAARTAAGTGTAVCRISQCVS